MAATYLCFSLNAVTAKQAIGLITGDDLELESVGTDEEGQAREANDAMQSRDRRKSPDIRRIARGRPALGATTLAGSAICAADLARAGVALGKPLDPDTVADLRCRRADGGRLLALRLGERHAARIGQQIRRRVPLPRCDGNLLVPGREPRYAG